MIFSLLISVTMTILCLKGLLWFFLLLYFKISRTLSHIFDVHMYYLVPPLTEHCIINIGRNGNYIIVYISVLLNTLSITNLIYFNTTIFCNDKINILSNHSFFCIKPYIIIINVYGCVVTCVHHLASSS